MLRYKSLLLLLVVAISACALEPFSRIDGRDGTQGIFGRADVQIVAVDGQWYFDAWPFRDVEPGVHEITFISELPQLKALNGSREFADAQTISFDFKPCVRYFFQAIHEVPNRPRDWKLVLDRTQPLSGCEVSEQATAVASSHF